MLFRKVGNNYVASVLLTNERATEFKLDTGSPFTTLSLKTLSDTLKCTDMGVVKRELLSYEYVEAISYTRNNVRLVPVYIRNVRIDDVIIDRFYCFINVDIVNSTSLIGTDFISSCTVYKTDASYGFELGDMDKQAYENNFKMLCYTENIHEIFELVTVEPAIIISSLFNAARGDSRFK